VPMGLGAMRVHKRLFDWLEGNGRALVVLVGLFLIGAIVKKLQVEGVLAEPAWMTGRIGLGPTRVGHSLLVLLLYASALTMGRRFLDRQPLRAIGAVGRHSLDCFALGVVATYALGVLWGRSGGGYPAYYLLVAIGVGLTVVAAHRLDARKGRDAPAGQRGAPLARNAMTGA
jgi:hypothetical protein